MADGAGRRTAAAMPPGRQAVTTRRGSGYNAKLFDPASDATMEAEQLNSIENRIADVAERGNELRRYL
ncbi:MAG: peptide chain release factor 2 [Candidatus Accumulibacter similis]|nr:MAG: peptide chain release factor 2 [Candidatus Accumulibacter similis]